MNRWLIGAAAGTAAFLAGLVHADAHPRFPWCGWYARHHLVSHDPGPEYNLARRWLKWGRATAAQVGAIVVWPHHVGRIVGRAERGWIIKSGNDGGRVRERVRSVSNAIGFRIEG